MVNQMMKASKKLTALLAIGILAIGLTAGCGGSNGSSSSQEKVMRVGAETTYPPMEFNDNGKYIGFDIDLTEAIAKKMGYKYEFKSMGFDALIPALKSNDIDVVASAVNPTPERAQAVSFSDVYLNEGGFVVVVPKNKTDITSMDSLANKTIAAQIGTVPADMSKKVSGATVKEIDSISQIFNELKAGTADATILDAAVARYYLAQGADKDLKIVGEPTKSDGFVMLFRKDDKNMQEAVNKALKELKDDGTYQQIYDKWFKNKK